MDFYSSCRFFLLLISKFQSECRTPSVPSKCFLRLRSENYSIFLCVCWCCAMASKIVARRTILDSKREWIFVGKLYANHTQISKCLAFLAILIVYALHCIVFVCIVFVVWFLSVAFSVYDHVAILYVNFFSGIPHAVDNFNCKTS